jgi:hypothetical protein
MGEGPGGKRPGVGEYTSGSGAARGAISGVDAKRGKKLRGLTNGAIARAMRPVRAAATPAYTPTFLPGGPLP